MESLIEGYVIQFENGYYSENSNGDWCVEDEVRLASVFNSHQEAQDIINDTIEQSPIINTIYRIRRIDAVLRYELS